jgi:ribonuclease HI
VVRVLKDDPTRLLVYTDGSQLTEKESKRRKTEAGYIFYCQGIKILEKEIGMGDEAEVYNAELLALAKAAARAVPFAIKTETDDIPTIRHIHFFADNDAAVGRVIDHTPKSGQALASRFWTVALTFLDAHTENKIEISWIPGHQDIDENEEVDGTAKRATEIWTRVAPTLTHARRKIKENSKHAITLQWLKNREKYEGFSEADHFAPSNKPRNHFLKLPRRLYALVLQCRTGHSFTGEYYNRHVPAEDPGCPCEATALETRDHILAYCQRYDEDRYLLEEASEGVEMKTLLGTDDGIAAVAEFIRATGAFTKEGRTRRTQEMEMEG